MPGDAGSRVIREYALETHTHLRRSVSNDYLSGVQRIADSDSAAMVKGDPCRAARDVQHRVENRPVGDRISAVAHAFCLTERRSHTSCVEMIATDGYRCRDLARRHELIDGHAELCTIRLPKPADASRQSLELDLLTRERDPASQMFVIREELERERVGAVDVARL